MKGTCVLMALALAAASCATVPPPAPGTTSSPMPGHDPVPAPSSAAGRSAGTASPMPGGAPAHPSSAPQVSASVDSQPSREALAVLNTIPEPLGPGERVAAPSKAAIAADTSAAQDSAGVAPAAGDSAQVPTPAPTQALGDRPGSLTSTPPSSPPSSAPAAAAAAASSAAAVKSVNPDSCWRVQVGAPPEEDKANAVRAAAQSQLQVPFVIEVEGGLRKVRTRECLDMAAADLLRRRAVAAGFEGAFRIKGPHK